MGRKFFVGGNWKMNGTKASIDKIVEFLKEGPLDPNTGQDGVKAVFLFLSFVQYNSNTQFESLPSHVSVQHEKSTIVRALV